MPACLLEKALWGSASSSRNPSINHSAIASPGCCLATIHTTFLCVPGFPAYKQNFWQGLQKPPEANICSLKKFAAICKCQCLIAYHVTLPTWEKSTIPRLKGEKKILFKKTACQHGGQAVSALNSTLFHTSQLVRIRIALLEMLGSLRRTPDSWLYLPVYMMNDLLTSVPRGWKPYYAASTCRMLLTPRCLFPSLR